MIFFLGYLFFITFYLLIVLFISIFITKNKTITIVFIKCYWVILIIGILYDKNSCRMTSLYFHLNYFYTNENILGASPLKKMCLGVSFSKNTNYHLPVLFNLLPSTASYLIVCDGYHSFLFGRFYRRSLSTSKYRKAPGRNLSMDGVFLYSRSIHVVYLRKVLFLTNKTKMWQISTPK